MMAYAEKCEIVNCGSLSLFQMSSCIMFADQEPARLSVCGRNW